MGSYPNGEIGMATVAEQTMAKNAEKVLMHTGQHYDENVSVLSCTDFAGCNHRDTR
jgi:hypothetical protein